MEIFDMLYRAINTVHDKILSMLRFVFESLGNFLQTVPELVVDKVLPDRGITKTSNAAR